MKFELVKRETWMSRFFRQQWAPTLALLSAVVAASIAIRHAGQPLVEWDAFRQTMTALTSYWMVQEGWRIPHQTPMLGYPWVVPLEFPIYQTIVALVAKFGDFPLEPVGRLVSFGFLLACAWPALKIAERLRFPSYVAWIFCALLWSSPQYLFWGRTFLMETTAVFFTLAAIPYALDLRDANPSWRSALLFSLFASLGMLQKSITTAPVILIIGLIVLIQHLRQKAHNPSRWFLLVTAFLVPVMVGVLWAYYASFIRSENSFGTIAFAPKVYLGETELRLNWGAWKTILVERIFVKNAGAWLGFFVIVSGVVLATNKVRLILLLCLALFILPIILFMNSHWWLEYYQTSNTLFLLAALAISIYVLESWLSLIAPVIAAVLMISNWANFGTNYWGILTKKLTTTNTRTLAIGDVVNRYTDVHSSLVVFGLTSYDSVKPVTSYSPEILYYSYRKGLTVESGWDKRMSEHTSDYLGGKDPGAIVVCKDLQRYIKFIEQYDNASPPNIFKVNECYVWLPNVSSIILPNGRRIYPLTTIPAN